MSGTSAQTQTLCAYPPSSTGEPPLRELWAHSIAARSGPAKNLSLPPSFQRKNPPSVAGALTLSQHLARGHKGRRINK